MPNLLDGIKVIDWTQAHHGAATGYMLGDLGADVIKVEDPQGDIARSWRSIMGVSLELPQGQEHPLRGRQPQQAVNHSEPQSGSWN